MRRAVAFFLAARAAFPERFRFRRRPRALVCEYFRRGSDSRQRASPACARVRVIADAQSGKKRGVARVRVS